MSDSVYLELREFLDRLPGGFPATESGVEIRILKKLFTPEEARMAMRLNPLRPETAAQIAARLRLDEREASAQLEAMAERGLIFRFSRRGKNSFIATQFAVGVYEWQLNRLDREVAELMEEYLPHLTASWSRVKTKQLRVVPVGKAVDATPVVSQYDRIRELVKDKQLISLAPCICRKEQGLLGNHCSRPSDTCVAFDWAARYYIDNGMGREISQDELMAVLSLAEEHHLVASPANARDISFMCLCCGCCCAVLRGLKRMPRPADHVASSFTAAVDTASCVGCGLCLESCQMEAIVPAEGGYAVDEGRCIGCGLCLAACLDGAIALREKPAVAELPANLVETNMRIAMERALL